MASDWGISGTWVHGRRKDHEKTNSTVYGITADEHYSFGFKPNNKHRIFGFRSFMTMLVIVVALIHNLVIDQGLAYDSPRHRVTASGMTLFLGTKSTGGSTTMSIAQSTTISPSASTDISAPLSSAERDSASATLAPSVDPSLQQVVSITDDDVQLAVPRST
ncbi:hypothetical protein N7453_000956 [Penicillium expansum]|nr:hypothetical protein N7453_000956 [Penicillium expansum]